MMCLEVRLGLEELAMQFACERIDEEHLQEIARAAQDFEDLMEEGDIHRSGAGRRPISMN